MDEAHDDLLMGLEFGGNEAHDSRASAHSPSGLRWPQPTTSFNGNNDI